MLLRRITQHVKDQNWFAVALDFFIVVVGILIAFQITNWNEARQDRIEEIQALHALKDNIVKTLHDLNTEISRTTTGQSSLKILAEYSDGDHDELTTTELDRHILYGIYTLPYFKPTMVAYDELRNTGRIGLISNTELRTKLQTHSKELEALARDEAGMSKMSYETSDPFLLKHVDWKGFTSVNSINGWQPESWIDPLKERRDLKAALRQPEFQNIVLYRARLNFSYLNAAEVYGSSLAELESLIDRHLEDIEGN